MEKTLVTRKAAAQVLGVSLPTLDKLINREVHALPHIRIGRKVCISPDALRRWVEEEQVRQNGQAV